MGELVFPSTAGFKKYEQLFDADSVRHPAKMNLRLLSWLIDHYSKVGDWVLDPMAGTFSTCIIGSLKGRNSIGVELEQKFVDMGLKNKAKLDRLQIQGKGECRILQGDARNLCEVLGKRGLFDVIVTSPTYSDRSEHRLGYDYQKRDKERGFKPYDGFRESYSDSSDNVGNLKYGVVDAVVCSPPYSETKKGDGIDESRSIDESRYKGNREKARADFERLGYKLGYSDSAQNIGNLKHGNIDAVITSPPYEKTVKDHGKSDRATKVNVEKRNYVSWQYGEGENQVGNLKGETYLSAMRQIYAECWNVLKASGVMVLVTKNFIRNKVLVRLDSDTIKLCESVSFKLKERHKFKLPQQSFWRINYYKKYPDVPKIEHEDVLVFAKEGVLH